MDSNRYGEHRHTPFRSQRLFSVNGQWYFDTREGNQFGPYQDKNEAKKALAVFVAQGLRGLNGSRLVNNGLGHGGQDSIEHMVDELLKYFRYCNNYGQTVALAWAQRRLEELTENRENISKIKERMEALNYAMDQE